MERELTPIEAAFKAFTNGNNEMKGTQFSRLCKSCGLIDDKFSTIDADIIFNKVKPNSTARTIYFREFQKGIDEIARKKGMLARDVVQKICETKKPIFTGTKPVYTRLYDDKSTYTGCMVRSGPNIVDSQLGKITSLADVCDRAPADVRGVKYRLYWNTD